MDQTQFPSIEPHGELANELIGLVSRTAAMGLVAEDVAVPRRIDRRTIRSVLSALQAQHLARDADLGFGPLLKEGHELTPAAAAEMAIRVRALNDVLGQSPAPATEWASMRKVLGDEGLAALVGISPASLRRYSNGERETPQAIAEKLHWLAMVVADLGGSYNEFGIRRWFERPRHQLGGKSPRQRLGVGWTADAKAAAQVKALSSALVGAQPLAA